MLNKLFIATLLLVLTKTANALPMKPGISGEFDTFSVADIVLNDAGEVTLITFFSSNVAVVQPGDYVDYLTAGQDISYTNPYDISEIVGLELWTVEGFAFTATDVVTNSTEDSFTSLTILGDVLHADFTTTSTEFFLSFQNLTVGGSKISGFSATVTSPAPAAIPEPSTLAIFALGLIGFAASRKKKSV